jgi:hypothetical protein
VPAGSVVAASGPTETIRSPRITITPLSITPPSGPAMVTIRAPVRAIVPVGLSAATSIASDTPVRGGWNLGAFSAVGADAKKASVLAVYSVGPRLQWSLRPLSDQ